MKKAFTLMEVNLAIMVMATGLLAIVSLYSYGYRENRQSRDDVAAAVYADAVMSPLVMALSATNLSWSAFNSLKSYPSKEGWTEYYENGGNPDSMAQSVYGQVMSKVGSAAGVTAGFPTAAAAGMKAGLVIIHNENSPIVGICFRACKHAKELLSMPVFYTEVCFQGDPSK